MWLVALLIILILLLLRLEHLPLGFLVLNLDLNGLDTFSELLMPILQFELVQLSGADLAREEFLFHLKLLLFLLQSNLLFLLDPDAAVDAGALSIQLISFLHHGVDIGLQLHHTGQLNVHFLELAVASVQLAKFVLELAHEFVFVRANLLLKTDDHVSNLVMDLFIAAIDAISLRRLCRVLYHAALLGDQVLCLSLQFSDLVKSGTVSLNKLGRR